MAAYVSSPTVGYMKLRFFRLPHRLRAQRLFVYRGRPTCTCATYNVQIHVLRRVSIACYAQRCLFVCLSVTVRYHVKITQATIM